MESNFRDDEIVKVQGRKYPVVGGRLRLAHEENKELSITTNVLNLSEERVVVQANIKTAKGNFSGLGNASFKRDKLLSNALIELAETRSIARALRFAGYGVEFTGFEEITDTNTNESLKTATKGQLESIATLAKNINISSKELHQIMYEYTGKNKSTELTSEDAHKLLSALKGKNKNEQLQ